MAPYSGVSNHNLPPPDKLREEARIQLEVQSRLKQLAEQAAPGTDKIKSQRGGLWRSLLKIGSNGPMSLCYPVKTRTGCPITSFPPSSGWLASAEPCERSQAYKIVTCDMLDYLINLLEDATDFSWVRRKPSMLSCCVGWNKVKSKVGQKWKKLTVLEGFMHCSMWLLLTVLRGVRKKHTVMQKLFPVSISKKVLAFKSNLMKLGKFSIIMSAHTTVKKKQKPFHIHKQNAKRWLQKQINRGMPNKGYVQKARLVVNSEYDKTTVKQLLSLSVQQCVNNFHLGMAMATKKDHRSYAQVVSGKCESNHMSHHLVHSDTVKNLPVVHKVILHVVILHWV